MNTKSLRGEVLTTVVLVLALAGVAGVLAGWRPLDAFRKKPDVAALTQLQTDLAASQAREAAARTEAKRLQDEKDKAAVSERKAFVGELRSAQQSNVGAEHVLRKLAPEKQTPETRLGTAMVIRTNLRMATALGTLPDDLKLDILEMMDGVLKDRDDAIARLIETDKKFAALTGEHEMTKKVLASTSADLVVATKKVEVLSSETGKVQGQVTIATNTIKDIAKKLSDEKSKSSSALEAAGWWVDLALWLGGAWGFFALIVPGIVKVMRPGQVRNILRDASGYALNPLQHHDAKLKIEDLKAQVTSIPFKP